MENENKINYIELVDNISNAIGSKNDEEIEIALTDLITLKEYVTNVDEQIQDYINRENEQNETIIALRQSNNKLFRQIAMKDKEKEKANEEISRIDMLDKIF